MTAGSNECDSDGSSLSQATAIWIGVLLVVGALLVRGAVCFRGTDQFSSDPDAYQAIAETLGATGVFGLTAASGETVPTAFRPPLYPFLLSSLVVDQHLPKVGVAVLHTALGAWAVLLTYLAGLSMLRRRTWLWGPIAAAVLVMIDPLLLRQSTLIMTETLATALVCTVIWWWARYRNEARDTTFGLVLGGLLALAFLTRPTFLVWAILLVAAGVFYNWRLGRAKGRQAVAAVAIIALVVGAWTFRNARTVGHPVWATTHGGYTLLLGNNPSFYAYLNSDAMPGMWDSESFQIAYSHRYDGDPRTAEFWEQNWNAMREVQSDEVVRQTTEHSDDRLAYESARAVIKRQPSMFLWAAGVRVGRLWNPFPSQMAGRVSWTVVVVGVYCCCLFAAMLIGCFRLGRDLLTENWWPVLALFLTLTLVHTVYWSNIRMRAPAIPAIALLASAAIPVRPRRTEGSIEVRDACG